MIIKKIVSILSKNWLLISLAIIIGLIHVSHHFFIPQFISDTDKVYYPITLESEYDQAAAYAPRANSVFLGDYRVGDISSIENINGPTPFTILPPLIMGGLGKIAGSVRNAIIISDFIFPILIFIAIFALLYEIKKRKTFAIVGAVLFIFAPKIGTFLPPATSYHIKSLVAELIPLAGDPNILFFARFEYPKVTFIFLILAFLFIYKSLVTNSKKNTILAGISLGLLFYTDFYHWMYTLSALGIMGLIFLLKKENKGDQEKINKKEQIKKLAFIIAIGFSCAIFYFINLAQLGQLPHYSDIVGRVGVETGRFFRFITWKGYFQSILFISVLWVILSKKNKILFVYLSSFLLSIIVVLNSQIITNVNPQPDHWYRTQILVLFLSIYIIFDRVQKKYLGKIKTKNIKVTLLIFFSILLFSEALQQYNYSKLEAQKYTIEISKLDSYRWLKENTPKYSVVAALSFETNADLLLHTNNKIIYPNGFNTTAPNSEIWQRYLLTNAIFNISEENFSKTIQPGEYTLTHLFHNYYREDKSFNTYIRGYSQRQLPETVYRDTLVKYKNIIENPIITIPYQLDYLYVEGDQTPRDNILGEVLYNQNNIKIYKVRKQ